METRLSLSAVTLPAASFGLAAQRPNVVFITAGDLGCGDLGCCGATRFETPACDRLAEEGTRFTDAHSPSAA